MGTILEDHPGMLFEHAADELRASARDFLGRCGFTVEQTRRAMHEVARLAARRNTAEGREDPPGLRDIISRAIDRAIDLELAERN